MDGEFTVMSKSGTKQRSEEGARKEGRKEGRKRKGRKEEREVATGIGRHREDGDATLLAIGWRGVV